MFLNIFNGYIYNYTKFDYLIYHSSGIKIFKKTNLKITIKIIIITYEAYYATSI